MKVKDFYELLDSYKYFSRLSQEDKLDVINKAYIEIKTRHSKEDFINHLPFENKEKEIVNPYEYDLLIEKYQVIDKLSSVKLDSLDLEWLFEILTFPAVNLLFKLASLEIVRKFSNEFLFETIQRQLVFEIDNSDLNYSQDIKVKDFVTTYSDKRISYKNSYRVNNYFVLTFESLPYNVNSRTKLSVVSSYKDFNYTYLPIFRNFNYSYTKELNYDSTYSIKDYRLDLVETKELKYTIIHYVI